MFSNVLNLVTSLSLRKRKKKIIEPKTTELKKVGKKKLIWLTDPKVINLMMVEIIGMF